MGPVVYTKNYKFNHFYHQYLVLLTMVPRNRVHYMQPERVREFTPNNVEHKLHTHPSTDARSGRRGGSEEKKNSSVIPLS